MEVFLDNKRCLDDALGMSMRTSRLRGHQISVSDVTRRIAELSPRRQEIIRPIFAAPRDFVLLSIRDTSDRLETDAAFLLRTIQKLGFPGYSDFKHYLNELAISNATSLERMREQGESVSSVEAAMRATIDRSMQNLTSLRNTLNLERISALAKRLHISKRILLIGGDLAANLVGYLEYQLTVLGLPVFATTGSGRTVHLMRTAGPEDTLLAISFRRGLRATVEGLKEAHDKKVYCVGITDTSISPIARHSNEFFITSIEGEALRSSYVAPFTFADVLITACANAKRVRTLKLLGDASDEQMHGYRWYED